MSSVPHPCAGNLLWNLAGDPGTAFPAPLDPSTYPQDNSDPGFTSTLCATEDCTGQDLADLDTTIGGMQPILDEIATDDAALDTQVAIMFPGTDLLDLSDLENELANFAAMQPASEAPVDDLGTLLGQSGIPQGTGGGPAPQPVTCVQPTDGVYTLYPNTPPAVVGQTIGLGPFPVSDWLLANGDSVPFNARVTGVQLVCGDPSIWGVNLGENFPGTPEAVETISPVVTPTVAGRQQATMAITFDLAAGTFYLYLDITVSAS